ncbi:MAG: ATP-dependent DNA helicase, partial [Acidimicrobiales bacterium]
GLGALARPALGGEHADRLVDDLLDAGRRLQAALEDHVGERVLADASAADDAGLGATLERCRSRVERVTAELRRRAGSGQMALTGGHPGPSRARQQRALGAAGHLTDDLQRLVAPTVDEVAWVDGTRHAPVLRLSPIDVAPALAATLWCQVTAVLTSATIPLRTAERLGLDSFELDQLDVGSPFDYRSHALLYVARHLPDRRRPESEAAVHDELEALIDAAGGRTLALFTSRRATEAAAAALAPRLPYRLLVQGQRPKGRLLAEFADDETSCLFATLGFWQGVDVPGRALTLVTVDRLPFARPDDPLLEARRERAGDAAFRLVDLPRAAMLLAQGAGRLIRSADDAGVVAVLDPRLATAGYRAALLAALPPMRRSTDRRQVADFLARVLATP